jgi:hypothetical protein
VLTVVLTVVLMVVLMVVLAAVLGKVNLGKIAHPRLPVWAAHIRCPG